MKNIPKYFLVGSTHAHTHVQLRVVIMRNFKFGQCTQQIEHHVAERNHARQPHEDPAPATCCRQESVPNRRQKGCVIEQRQGNHSNHELISSGLQEL